MCSIAGVHHGTGNVHTRPAGGLSVEVILPERGARTRLLLGSRFLTWAVLRLCVC